MHTGGGLYIFKYCIRFTMFYYIIGSKDVYMPRKDAVMADICIKTSFAFLAKKNELQAITSIVAI